MNIDIVTPPAGDLQSFLAHRSNYFAVASSQLTSFEVSKLFVRDDLGVDWASGWRLDVFDKGWTIGAGAEATARLSIRDEFLEGAPSDRVRTLMKDTDFGFFHLAGLRGLRRRDRLSLAWSIPSSESIGSVEVSSTFDLFSDLYTLSTQTNDHYAIGPQLGAGVVAESSMWRFEALVLGLVGYGNTRKEFVGRSAFPISYRVRRTTEHLALHGETRVSASCQLTQRWRFDTAWRWYATGPTYDAAGSVFWQSGNINLRASDSRVAYGDELFVGLTYTH